MSPYRFLSDWCIIKSYRLFYPYIHVVSQTYNLFCDQYIVFISPRTNININSPAQLQQQLNTHERVQAYIFKHQTVSDEIHVKNGFTSVPRDHDIRNMTSSHVSRDKRKSRVFGATSSAYLMKSERKSKTQNSLTSTSSIQSVDSAVGGMWTRTLVVLYSLLTLGPSSLQKLKQKNFNMLWSPACLLRYKSTTWWQSGSICPRVYCKSSS